MAEKKTVIKAGSKSAAQKLSLLSPRATEKAYTAQTLRTYLFFVDTCETKQSVAARVEKDYNVKVEDVRVLTRKGHKCRFSRGKHAYPGTAFRADKKLAYVTLAEGNSIRVFEAPEQGSTAQASADATSDKKSTKASAKSAESEAKSAEKTEKKAGKETN